MMETLNDFISRIKNEMPNNLNEISKARYIYIELGKIVYFDPNYIYGNSRSKNKIYKEITYNKHTLNEKFKSKIIICKSLSYIYEYILNIFGIHIYTTNATDDKHVYNEIITKDKKIYFADLQLDLENIQSRSKTKFFGTGQDYYFSVIDENNLREIDKSIGYIDNFNDYTDNNIEKFKLTLPNNLELDQKVELIMEYIYSSENTKNMKFIEISHYYNYVFDQILDTESKKNLYYAYCFNNYDKNKQYISIISVDVKKSNSKNYILYENNCKYIPIEQEEIVLMLKNKLAIRCGTLLIMKKHFTNTSSFHKL
ncbi:MAG: hypothetical protein PHD15_04330 [Clostridia bacterium]|nr:hypothetical protein [Clostridia bacterium]MDD4386968.1 hypothetical protein [Clostridia bacterium]